MKNSIKCLLISSGKKNNESAEGENSSNENKRFKFANQHELSKCVIFCVTFGEIIAINLISMYRKLIQNHYEFTNLYIFVCNF